MDFPKRKQNRLNEFDYSSNGAYFITICVKDMKCILSTISVGDDALGVPKNNLMDKGEIVDKYIKSTENIPGVYVDKYVVMPNHIHIILHIDRENGSPGASTPTKQLVPEAVGALKRLVSREIGENIFQRSYHDHIIRNQADYLKIWQYIDTNPLKWHDDCFYIKEE